MQLGKTEGLKKMKLDVLKLDNSQLDISPYQPFKIKYSRSHGYYLVEPVFSWWYYVLPDHALEIQCEPDNYGNFKWQLYHDGSTPYLDDEGYILPQFEQVLEALIEHAEDKEHFNMWAKVQKWVESENGYFALGYQDLDSDGRPFDSFESNDVLPIDFEDLPV